MSYSCVKLVTVLKLIIVLTVIGLETSEVRLVSSVANLRNCWSSANSTCIRAVIFDNFKDIWKKKEIRITDSIAIEKISNLSPEDYGTIPLKSAEQGRRYRGEADQILENVVKFLKTHALRVDLWKFGTLRIQRSQKNRGSLEIIFDMNQATPSTNGEGMLNIMRFSRADSRVKMLRFSDVSGNNSVPTFRVCWWTGRTKPAY
jgi:hypothetical protein